MKSEDGSLPTEGRQSSSKVPPPPPPVQTEKETQSESGRGLDLELPRVFREEAMVRGMAAEWTLTGADLSDYFNYGFNEDVFRIYARKMRTMYQIVGCLEEKRRERESGAEMWRDQSGHPNPATNTNRTEDPVGEETQPGTQPSEGRARLASQQTPDSQDTHLLQSGAPRTKDVAKMDLIEEEKEVRHRPSHQQVPKEGEAGQSREACELEEEGPDSKLTNPETELDLGVGREPDKIPALAVEPEGTEERREVLPPSQALEVEEEPQDREEDESRGLLDSSQFNNKIKGTEGQTTKHQVNGVEEDQPPCRSQETPGGQSNPSPLFNAPSPQVKADLNPKLDIAIPKPPPIEPPTSLSSPESGVKCQRFNHFKKKVLLVPADGRDREKVEILTYLDFPGYTLASTRKPAELGGMGPLMFEELLKHDELMEMLNEDQEKFWLKYLNYDLKWIREMVVQEGTETAGGQFGGQVDRLMKKMLEDKADALLRGFRRVCGKGEGGLRGLGEVGGLREGDLRGSKLKAKGGRYIKLRERRMPMDFDDSRRRGTGTEKEWKEERTSKRRMNMEMYSNYGKRRDVRESSRERGDHSSRYYRHYREPFAGGYHQHSWNHSSYRDRLSDRDKERDSHKPYRDAFRGYRDGVDSRERETYHKYRESSPDWEREERRRRRERNERRERRKEERRIWKEEMRQSREREEIFKGLIRISEEKRRRKREKKKLKRRRPKPERSLSSLRKDSRSPASAGRDKTKRTRQEEPRNQANQAGKGPGKGEGLAESKDAGLPLVEGGEARNQAEKQSPIKGLVSPDPKKTSSLKDTVQKDNAAGKSSKEQDTARPKKGRDRPRDDKIEEELPKKKDSASLRRRPIRKDKKRDKVKETKPKRSDGDKQTRLARKKKSAKDRRRPRPELGPDDGRGSEPPAGWVKESRAPLKDKHYQRHSNRKAKDGEEGGKKRDGKRLHSRERSPRTSDQSFERKTRYKSHYDKDRHSRFHGYPEPPNWGERHCKRGYMEGYSEERFDDYVREDRRRPRHKEGKRFQERSRDRKRPSEERKKKSRDKPPTKAKDRSASSRGRSPVLKQSLSKPKDRRPRSQGKRISGKSQVKAQSGSHPSEKPDCKPKSKSKDKEWKERKGRKIILRRKEDEEMETREEKRDREQRERKDRESESLRRRIKTSKRKTRQINKILRNSLKIGLLKKKEKTIKDRIIVRNKPSAQTGSKGDQPGNTLTTNRHPSARESGAGARASAGKGLSGESQTKNFQGKTGRRGSEASLPSPEAVKGGVEKQADQWVQSRTSNADPEKSLDLGKSARDIEEEREEGERRLSLERELKSAVKSSNRAAHRNKDISHSKTHPKPRDHKKLKVGSKAGSKASGTGPRLGGKRSKGEDSEKSGHHQHKSLKEKDPERDQAGIQTRVKGETKTGKQRRVIIDRKSLNPAGEREDSGNKRLIIKRSHRKFEGKDESGQESGSEHESIEEGERKFGKRSPDRRRRPRSGSARSRAEFPGEVGSRLGHQDGFKDGFQEGVQSRVRSKGKRPHFERARDRNRSEAKGPSRDEDQGQRWERARARRPDPQGSRESHRLISLENGQEPRQPHSNKDRKKPSPKQRVYKDRPEPGSKYLEYRRPHPRYQRSRGRDSFDNAAKNPKTGNDGHHRNDRFGAYHFDDRAQTRTRHRDWDWKDTRYKNRRKPMRSPGSRSGSRKRHERNGRYRKHWPIQGRVYRGYRPRR